MGNKTREIVRHLQDLATGKKDKKNYPPSIRRFGKLSPAQIDYQAGLENPLDPSAASDLASSMRETQDKITSK